MASSLFSNNNSGIPNGSNGNLLQRFAAFKKQMAGKDPEAIVKQMLADGRMSQEQFEKLKIQAQGLMSILR